VLTLNDAQVWTVIGVFAVALFSVLTLTSTMFLRVLRAEVGRIEVKIDSLDQRLNTRIDSLDQRINGRVDSLESKMNLRFDTLDRDVGVLFRRAFGGDPE
jgi:hypothetical protein